MVRPIAAGDTGRSADDGYPTAPLKVAGATALGARTGDLPVSVYGGGSWSSWRAGHQRGSACDGHLGCTCGRPLSQLTHLGDPERGLLRRGNRYSAEFRRLILLPVIAGSRALKLPGSFRGEVAPAIRGGVHPAGFLRRPAPPRPVRTSPQTTWRQEWIEVAAEVVRHEEVLASQSAEAAAPGALYASILGRIGRLRVTLSPGSSSVAGG